MKKMFKVMAEYSDYEGRRSYFDHKVGMVDTLEQAHELANANVTANNDTHATGRYQVIECTMDEATFTYTEKTVFKDYTKAMKIIVKNREIKDCLNSIERYKNHINELNAKIEKRKAQGKEPAKTWIKDLEMYQDWLAKEQKILAKIQ